MQYKRLICLYTKISAKTFQSLRNCFNFQKTHFDFHNSLFRKHI